jgi:hypothetical protein
MPTEDKGAHLPPSSARIAAAARAGLFPRSPLLPLGGALAGLGCALLAFGSAVGRGLLGLVDGGLAAAVSSRPDPVDALVAALGRGARIAVPLLLAPALAALLAALIPALVARRFGRGSTSNPLPEAPGFRPGRAVLRVAAIAVAAAAVAHGFAAGRPNVESAAAALVAAGTALLLAGLAEIALERARLFEALRLTRSEARREQGVPETARRLRRAP